MNDSMNGYIIMYILIICISINTLLNVILILRAIIRDKSIIKGNPSSDFKLVYTFWRVYLFIFPFFITNKIIKEIEAKKGKENANKK